MIWISSRLHLPQLQKYLLKKIQPNSVDTVPKTANVQYTGNLNNDTISTMDLFILQFEDDHCFTEFEEKSHIKNCAPFNESLN